MLPYKLMTVLEAKTPYSIFKNPQCGERSMKIPSEIKILRNKIKVIIELMVLIFAIIFFTTIGTPLLFSRENGYNTNHTQASFFEELSFFLIKNGWKKDEVSILIEEARKLEWKEAIKADPEVLALALSLGKKEGIDLEPMEQAQLAIEIALTVVEMKTLGYSDRVVVRAAINGIRNMLLDIQDWKRKGKKGKLGEIIRANMREQVRTAAVSQVHEHAMERMKKQSRRTSESGFSYIPGNISPWSSSYTDGSQYSEPNINIPGKP